MLKIFTLLADFITYNILNLEPELKIADSIHFFIEDVTKIFFLVIIMIYVIGILRATLNTEKVRNYLSGKNRFIGYFLASIFGAITPFCSCSSIPLFLAFTSAKIPLGITMSFLITSPMINEVAIVLLGSLLGIKFLLLYIITGILAGVIGGFFIDLIKGEKYLTQLTNEAKKQQINSKESIQTNFTLKDRHTFALDELKQILSRIWKWIFIGIGLGSLIHGFIPSEFILEHMGSHKWWNVPIIVLMGIPLYSNASGIIPIAESLLIKGMPIGTVMAFMMSVVAASFPEFMLLKQVMKPKLLVIFFIMLLVFFTIAGIIFNFAFA